MLPASEGDAITRVPPSGPFEPARSPRPHAAAAATHTMSEKSLRMRGGEMRLQRARRSGSCRSLPPPGPTVVKIVHSALVRALQQVGLTVHDPREGVLQRADCRKERVSHLLLAWRAAKDIPKRCRLRYRWRRGHQEGRELHL